MRKFCPNCKLPLYSEEDLFCPFCGTKQQKAKKPKFHTQILKCLGYFAVYYAIAMGAQLIYEMIVAFSMERSGAFIGMDAKAIQYLLLRKVSEYYSEIGIVSAVAVLITYAIIFAVRGKSIKEEVKLNSVKPFPAVLLLLFGMASQVVVTVAVSIIYSLFPSLSDYSVSKSFDLLFADANPYLMFVYIGIITPLLEETVFRGLIYTRLRKVLPASGAVILSAVVFGVTHGNLEQGIYATLLGIVLAFAFEKFDSLWASFAIHFAFNSFSFALSAIPENASGLYYYIFLASIGIMTFTLIMLLVMKKPKKAVIN